MRLTWYQDRARLGAYVFAAIALVQIVLVFLLDRGAVTPAAVNYGFAVEIGLLVGATEMISRYQDEPFAPLISVPGIFYIAINGGAAALAYFLMTPLGVTLSEPMRTLAAGLGAMAFFRSGLFTVRLGGSDVAVGPNLVLQVLLQALDRTYDRQRAVPRSHAVLDIMSGVSFAQVQEALPTLCFDLMQNVSDAEISAINAQVSELAASTTMADDAKVLSLGLALINIVGERTLRAAVEALGNNVQGFRQVGSQMLVDLAKIDPETAVRMLPIVCAELPTPRGGAGWLQPPEIKLDKSLSPESQAVLVLYKLVDFYGDQRVAVALGILASQAAP